MAADRLASEGDPFRKIGFVIALGVLGAAAIDIAVILAKAVRQFRASGRGETKAPDWKRTNIWRLVLWVLAWGGAVFFIGLQMPVCRSSPGAGHGAGVRVPLINGISTGIVTVSAAFVIGVFLMATFGLKDVNGLMCAAVLLVACSVRDMQQDRSTGWRLGTNRVIRFRYQMLGILTDAVLCVVTVRFLAPGILV